MYEYVNGWGCDISGCRTFAELPEAAQQYVKYIEAQMECPVQFVSVGADREAYIRMF